MTSSELDRIEKELNIVVPRTYREFMTTGIFGQGDEGMQDLTGSADEVIRKTKYSRIHGFFGAKWPDNYLIIGDDGAGDDYFIDVNEKEPAVQFADHELTSVERRLVISEREKYATLAEFWGFLEKNLEEVNISMERQSKKRWWQFWIP